MDDADLDRLSAALREGIGRVHRRFRALRAQGELGDAAMTVLSRIRKYGPMSLTVLSNDARVTPATMSQTVNRLVAGGYLLRGPDADDGRRVLFHLTDDGRRVEAANTGRSIAWFDGQLAATTAEERAVLAEAATIMIRFAES